MTASRFYFLTLLFLLLFLGYLTYEIMRPFFGPMAWAAVFSIVLYPVYLFVVRLVKIKSLASVITVLVLLAIIVGPFTYLTSVLVRETQSFVTQIDAGKVGSLEEAIRSFKSLSLVQTISPYVHIEQLSQETVMENVRTLGKNLMSSLSLRITNIISAALGFVITVFTTFFLLRDGANFFAKTRDFLPFSDAQKDRLARQVKDMIVSTVYGGVVVAIFQGILGGVAFAVIGIETPVLWGVAMSIMSFVPLVGTFAIWGPASLYLIIQGDLLHGAALFLYGVFVISMVDNILKPVIIGSRTKMHTLLILFSVLGGINFLGMIGFIMGPLITAVFLSVFEIVNEFEG